MSEGFADVLRFVNIALSMLVLSILLWKGTRKKIDWFRTVNLPMTLIVGWTLVSLIATSEIIAQEVEGGIRVPIWTMFLSVNLWWALRVKIATVYPRRNDEAV